MWQKRYFCRLDVLEKLLWKEIPFTTYTEDCYGGNTSHNVATYHGLIFMNSHFTVLALDANDLRWRLYDGKEMFLHNGSEEMFRMRQCVCDNIEIN